MKDIASEYSALRERALRAQRDRRANAYSKIDGLFQLERRYAQLQAELALATSRKHFDIDDERRINTELTQMGLIRTQMLESNGFSSDYLDLQYECVTCCDYGFLSDGAKCSCYEKKAFARRNRASNLVGFETQTFEAFNENIFPIQDGQRERIVKLKAICNDYAKNFPDNNRKNLVLIGNAGLGKSFLLNCIGRKILDNGHSVVKLTANHFHQAIISEVIGNRNPAPMHYWESVDLLLFDDLGCEPSVNNIVEQHFYALLNERVMLERPIAIATNLSIDEIRSRYGERTFSRMFDIAHTRSLQFKGDDIRLRRQL